MKTHKILQAPIPMRWVGPMKLSGHLIEEKLSVPLATYETPLWPSVGRGARISTLCEEELQLKLTFSAVLALRAAQPPAQALRYCAVLFPVRTKL